MNSEFQFAHSAAPAISGWGPQRVVCLLGNTAADERALAWAGGVASHARSRVTIVMMIRSASRRFPHCSAVPFADLEIVRAMTDDHVVGIDRARRLCTDLDVRADVAITESYAATLEAVRPCRPDLIVAGHRRRCRRSPDFSRIARAAGAPLVLVP